MNFAHIHLILNHIPLLMMPVVLVFLFFARQSGEKSTHRFGYLMLFAVAAMALPVYLTGEPAEEVVEHLPGVAESFIESHEDAAKISLILTLLAGLSGLVAWWPVTFLSEKIREVAVWTLSVVAILSLGYTANLGGKVRHSELRGESRAVGLEQGADGGEQGSEADEPEGVEEEVGEEIDSVESISAPVQAPGAEPIRPGEDD